MKRKIISVTVWYEAFTQRGHFRRDPLLRVSNSSVENSGGKNGRTQVFNVSGRKCTRGKCESAIGKKQADRKQKNLSLLELQEQIMSMVAKIRVVCNKTRSNRPENNTLESEELNGSKGLKTRHLYCSSNEGSLLSSKSTYSRVQKW